MKDIKIKDIGVKTIKTLDKTVTGLKNTKDNLVEVKNNVDNISTKEESVNQGASDKIIASSNYAKGTTIVAIPKIGNKATQNTKNNLIKLKTNKTKKLTEKTNKKIIKGGKQAIKTSSKSMKNSVKVAKSTVENTRRTILAIKQLTHKSYLAIKSTIIATAKAIKLAIMGTKALISAIIAGGWVAIVIIILICVIGLLCSSIFGIFFSGQNSTSHNSITVNDVIAELNLEFADKIATIQEKNIYDDYKLNINRASWSDVLAIYTAKTTSGLGANEVMTMNDTKKDTLKQVFWDMHTITYEIKTETIDAGYLTPTGTTTNDTNQKQILYITVNSKTADEMMKQYYFTLNQRNEVNELLKEEYADLWSSVIYGTSIGSPSLVQIAKSQLGNVGGQPYWSWYGYNSRVEWCATFVSWVANEAGYIDSNVIPKFAGVYTGIEWFKMMGQWKDNSYIPNEGAIIFYDWETDGSPDHVAIVEKVENNKIYTIEGNMDDKVQNLNYDVNDKVIFGYGVPNY